ncbi:MAG TPA: dTMP kinase [Gammaproteobacteria bacterium]|nr:dTMP kinase [Gammaproteobacteria bacterium]
MNGCFITVEGGEGAGKSSNLAFVRRYLEQHGKQLVVTREPGGTSLGEAIRALLLDHRNNEITDDTELLLMFAARAQHIAEVIRPALEQGKWVLCDRFTDATYAYQGGGRGISRERIAVLEQWVQQGLEPDLTLLLDIPVLQGLERAGQRSAPDRFEREQNAFFERVRAAYLEQVRRNPQRYRVIDASKPLEQVQRSIAEVLAQWLAQR